MTCLENPSTDELVRRAGAGDAVARESLFSRHRQQLRRMIQLRIDPRLAKRLDPSDVIQDTLARAHRSLGDYLRRPPLPFYPWLRQIAWQVLVDLHRRHIRAERRSLRREAGPDLSLSNESPQHLSNCLISPEELALTGLLRRELRTRVRAALERLSPADREIVLLRHLEQMSVRDVAATLKVPEGTVKSRHFRALHRLRGWLEDP